MFVKEVKIFWNFIEFMSLLDVGKIFKIEMEKFKKEMDRVLIMKVVRGLFKERRFFIIKKYDGNLKEFLRKFLVFGKVEYVINIILNMIFMWRFNFLKNYIF